METVAEFSNADPSETVESVDTAKGSSIGLPKEPSKSSRPAVLVVDDDPTLLMLAGIHAGRVFPDYDIIEAQNAETAIEALSGVMGKSIAAILSDIVMPGLSGIELARVLRGEAVKGVRLEPNIVKKLRDVPVVLHTSCPAIVDPSTQEGARAAELVRSRVVQGVLKKGFPNPALFSHLARERRAI